MKKRLTSILLALVATELGPRIHGRLSEPEFRPLAEALEGSRHADLGGEQTGRFNLWGLVQPSLCLEAPTT